MTSRGITALFSSRLTVAVAVSAGIHAAVFGAVSLIPTQSRESVPVGKADSLRVELNAASSVSSSAGTPTEESVEPSIVDASVSAPEPDTAPRQVSASAMRADEQQEPARDSVSEGTRSEEAPSTEDSQASAREAEPASDVVSASTAPSTAATTAPDRTPRSSVSAATIRKPRPRAPINPSYPRRARRLGWEGTAVVRATVEADGSPTALHIVASSGYELLNQAALAAVRSTTFYPGIVGASQRRRMNVDLRIVFQLVNKESS